MIKSVNPFNDPEVKKQLLQEEGVEMIEPEEEIEDEIKSMLSAAPILPKSPKNIILDASSIAKSEKEQKSKEFNYVLGQIITKYNEKYHTEINFDLENMSSALLTVSDPEKRKVLELYCSELFKSARPIILLHLLNRLVLCMDYVLNPSRMLDQSVLSLPDLFLVIEKLISYTQEIQNLIDQSTIKDSDAILDKMADEQDDNNFNSPESKKAVEDFMRLFKKDKGIED